MKGIFNETPYLLVGDWGTTSFRIWLVDGSDKRVLAKKINQCGIKYIHNQWQQDEKGKTRVTFFLHFLQQQISQLSEQTDRPLDGIPVTLSGMASSSIGITELAYGSVPFSLNKPLLPSQLFPKSEQFPHDLLLLSGLRTTGDVMRGEESQLIGLAADRTLRDCICIMPGTHSKHVFIDHEEITEFKTYMSGEIFELLSSQSILADSVNTTEKILNTAAFHEGVQQAQADDFLHAIFGVRTNDLLLNIDKKMNSELLSGIIIGTELSRLVEWAPAEIFLMGDHDLTDRYKAALQYLDFDPISVPNIDELTIQGHLTILNHKI